MFGQRHSVRVDSFFFSFFLLNCYTLLMCSAVPFQALPTLA